MKIHKFFLFNLLILFWQSPVFAQNNQRNPNDTNNNKPALGWSLWKPEKEQLTDNFTFGFSNSDMSELSSFLMGCNEDGTGTNIYWYRTKNTIQRLGAGEMQYICFFQNQWQLYSAIAVKTDNKNNPAKIDCLQVTNPQGITIYNDSHRQAKKLGKIRFRKKIKINYFPTEIKEANGENWLFITKPVTGWISDGKIDSKGNLKLCQ